MDKIKITLEVTFQQLLAITKVLDTSSASHTEPPEPKVIKEDPLPPEAVIKPQQAPRPITTPKMKMPTFGRNTAQIATYTEHEAERLENKAIEQIAKDERAVVRAVKKEEKDIKNQEAADKVTKDEDEVAAIKQLDFTHTPSTTNKPWG